MATTPDDRAEQPRMVCVGSYTAELDGRGVGISSFRYRGDGGLEPLGELATPSPSWLVWHPSEPVLYCANESDGRISVIRVAPDGSLRLTDTVSSGGTLPCHLAVTPDGRFLLGANYGSGSTIVLALGSDGGITGRTELADHGTLGLSPGPVADRQDGPHAHMVVLSDDRVVVVDLGLDALLSFRLSAKGRLDFASASRLPPGTGPRQLVRRPGTTTALVLGELAGTLTTLDETAPGIFAETASVPVGPRPGAAQCAQLTLDPAGRWALASARGVDTVVLFDLTGGAPRPVEEYLVGPGSPRHFGIVGRHVYVGNQDADELITFALDPATGRLTRGESLPVGSPVCVVSRPLTDLGGR